jgi:hypothetical protein
MRTANVILRSVIAGAVTLGLSMVVAPAASADTLVQSPKSHCYADSAGTTCYATAAEVREHAADRGAADYLLVIFYDGLDFTTDADWIAIWGPAPCTTTTGDIDYEDARFEEFNNRTSSVDTFNNCDVRLFDFFDPTRPDNPRTGWIHRDGNLATPGVNWSNRASAWQLS